MANSEALVASTGNRKYYALGAGLAVAVAALALTGCEAPVSVDDDVAATLPIDDEQHHPRRIRRRFSRSAYDTFTFVIEGQRETIRVPADVAAKYDEGDKVDITYDRRHWKDGSVTIGDVKLKEPEKVVVK